MKKLIVLFLGVCCLAMPSSATNFYLDQDSGEILMAIETCDQTHCEETLVQVTGDEEEEQNPASQPDENEQNADQSEENVDVNTAEIVQDMIAVLMGKKDAVPQKHALTQATESLDLSTIDEIDFEDLQEMLLAYVQDINWKTHLRLTYRDLNIFQRFAMLCKGACRIVKPSTAKLTSFLGDIGQNLEEVSDELANKLAESSRGRTFDRAMQLSVIGLVNAVDTQNPFLLMLVNQDTFEEMVRIEPQVKELYKNMFIFFKIRSTRMAGQEYDKNTKELIRVSELGKGNYFQTWKKMAQFALASMESDRKGLLNAQDERDIQIKRLEAAMRYIKEETRVEERAAEIAMADPNNAAMVYELQHGAKKKPSLDEKALELLKTLTPDQTKALIFKYKMK